jgi:hypothetical protein
MTNQHLVTNLLHDMKSWAVQNADKYLYVPLAKQHTDSTDSDEPLVPELGYFRLWLSEMFLAQSRQWFRDWYPAVHSSVQLRFGNQNTVRFSHVTRTPQDTLAQGVLLNYPLTELMPFKGGVVEIEAGLLALQGTDYLKASIDLLKDFSSLVAAPLGQALGIAEKVSNAIQNLFGATNGQVHLTWHQTLTSAGGGGSHEMKPGYIAVILATENKVNKERLYVKKDRLYYSQRVVDEPTPLQGYDYMLFRIETRKERDDWRLKNIQEPLDQAIEALLTGNSQKASFFKQLALVAASQSPDLTVYDRRRVAQAIKGELEYYESTGLGAIGDNVRDLNSIMATRAIPIENAVALGEITFDELFAK